MICRKGSKGAKIALLAIFLLSALLLSGCWNNRDLTEMNLVSAVGLERTKDGKLLLTVQVVEPAAIQSTSSGKGQGGNGSPYRTYVSSYEGDTLFETMRGILSTLDKKLFFSATQILILGENLAKDDIIEALDFFQRDHEINYKMYILVAKDVSPQEILENKTGLDPIEAMYLKKTVDNNVARGTVKRTMLIDLVKDIYCSGKQIAIGQITKSGKKEVRTEGIAVFKDGKLAGWLNRRETRGYLFAINQIKSTIVNVPVEEGLVAIETISAKGKVHVPFKKGKPAALGIKVNIEAAVGEYAGTGKLECPERIYELERKTEEVVRKEIEDALKKVQKEFSSDIFGFGQQVRKYNPKYWKKIKKEWNELFSELPADIKVKAKLRRVGSVRDSLEKDE